MTVPGKNNISLYHALAVALICVLPFLLSCGDSGTDPDSGNRIIISVVDHNGAPLTDVSITTRPETDTVATDNDGNAVIPIESWGAYTITATRPNGDFLEKQELVRTTDVRVDFRFAYSPLTLSVSDVQGRPMTGAEISLAPSALKLVTDESGTASKDSVLVRAYNLSITHGGETVYSSEISLSENNTNAYKITASQASITLTVTDPDGVPYDDVTVITEPSAFISRSDSSGIVILDNIPAIEYTISIYRYGILCTQKTVTLAPGENDPISVTLKNADITISLKNQFNRTYENAIVIIHPFPEKKRLNENGTVSFTRLPLGRCSLDIKWNNTTLYRTGILLEKEGQNNVSITYQAEQPTVSIISPEGPTIPHVGTVFTGEGSDTEDGALPDSVFVWQSSVDGELGRGRSITVGRLSGGLHLITLEVTDSDGLTNDAATRLTVLTYDSESYFPTPYLARWGYGSKNRVVTIETETGTEVWELGDTSVEIDTDDMRVTTMKYTKTVGSRTNYYTYTITDWLEYDGNAVHVSKTHELLEIDSNYNPLNVMNVTSTYEPSFPLIPDAFAIENMPAIDQSFHVEAVWKLRSGFVREFTESFNSHVHIEWEGTEQIMIPFGTFETAIIRIEQDNSIRRWWLTPGIGIIKMAFNMFDPMPESILMSTNLDSFRTAKDAPRPKAAGSVTTLTSPPSHDDIPDHIYRPLAIARMLNPFR